MLDRLDNTSNDLRCGEFRTDNCTVVHTIFIWNRFPREWLVQLKNAGYEVQFMARGNIYANLEGETLDDNLMAQIILQNRDTILELIKEEGEEEVVEPEDKVCAGITMY